MLDKYIGKKVKLLVSSNSGAGTSTAMSVGSSMTMVSSIITIFGDLKEIGDRFVELSNTRTIYMDSYQSGYVSMSGSKEISPAVLDNSSTLVNVNNIIAISLVG